MTRAMHDLRWLRDHPAEFDRGLARRGLAPRADEILALDHAWRAAETRVQEAQANRNRLSKEIAAFKAQGIAGGTDSIQLAPVRLAEEKAAPEAAAQLRPRLRAEIDTILTGLPNLPDDDVPDGADETRQSRAAPHR